MELATTGDMEASKELPPNEITDARESYLEKFRFKLIDKYEKTSVSTINAGIAGDNLIQMSKRLYWDLKSKTLMNWIVCGRTMKEICIVEDISNHITIHKAKGVEYENVFMVGNKDFLDFLKNPDIEGNEEHRVFYVALSRAKKRLFMYLDDLSISDESYIREKYTLVIDRIG